MQMPSEGTEAASALSVQLPNETMIRRAEDIAALSSVMIQLARDYLNSTDLMILDGIRSHFIDQAAVELLLGIELLQLSDETSGLPSTAETRATSGAALREAISAVEKSSSVPIAQGLPKNISYRSSEASTTDEAIAAFFQAAETAAGHISHRIQELGNDICFDIASGTERTEIIQWASLSTEEIGVILESMGKGPAGNLLLQSCRKIILPGKDSSIHSKVIEHFQSDGMQPAEIFTKLAEHFHDTKSLKKTIAAEIERSDATPDAINKASDLIKAFSDQLIVLISRMRKMEDAIRLAKKLEISKLKPVTISLQVALLSALLRTGQDYENNCLTWEHRRDA